LNLLQDMHVHSTFSDGADTIEANVAQAETLGLRELTCVDHVRADTTWVPGFVAAVRRAQAATDVALLCAVEAKLLDTTGALDLPGDIAGIDAIYAADHQVPLAGGPAHPRDVRALLASGELRAEAVIHAIVTATMKALDRPETVVIAHFLSVLPKLGLAESDVPADLLDELAAEAQRTGQRIEISERWRCPSATTLRPFARRGVPILLSTDSHRRGTIGRYDHCLAVARELEAPGVGT
jgi:putative hydrolase